MTDNRERLKRLLPLIQAFLDGKTIQSDFRGGAWDDDRNPMFTADVTHYRIKPETPWYEHIITAAKTYFRKATNVFFELPTETRSNCVSVYVKIPDSLNGHRHLRGAIGTKPEGMYWAEWYTHAGTASSGVCTLDEALDWIDERLGDEDENAPKQPKLVPWGPDDVPLVCWVRCVKSKFPFPQPGQRQNRRSTIHGIEDEGVTVRGQKITFQDLFDRFEHLSPANPTTWLPCAKEVKQ